MALLVRPSKSLSPQCHPVCGDHGSTIQLPRSVFAVICSGLCSSAVGLPSLAQYVQHSSPLCTSAIIITCTQRCTQFDMPSKCQYPRFRGRAQTFKAAPETLYIVLDDTCRGATEVYLSMLYPKERPLVACDRSPPTMSV